MLHIQLFGSLSVQQAFPDGRTITLLLTSRLANVLAFLALFRGHYFSREKLVAELWDDLYGSEVSQGAFNNILWRLRKNIEKDHYKAGELINRDCRGFICFRKEADVYLDIEEFRKKVRGVLELPIAQLKSRDIEALNSAVRLYQADILGDFNAEWALREREKLRRVYFKILGKLASYSRTTGDYGSSVRYAQLILDNEPLQEDIHRELMELYELNGQRALALRQFETCRNLLRKELAIPPMLQTMQLYQSIADHALHPSDYSHLEPHYNALEDFNILKDIPGTPDITGIGSISGVPQSQVASRALINQAREHMAIADAQLKHSANLLAK